MNRKRRYHWEPVTRGFALCSGLKIHLSLGLASLPPPPSLSPSHHRSASWNSQGPKGQLLTRMTLSLLTTVKKTCSNTTLSVWTEDTGIKLYSILPSQRCFVCFFVAVCFCRFFKALIKDMMHRSLHFCPFLQWNIFRRREVEVTTMGRRMNVRLTNLTRCNNNNNNNNNTVYTTSSWKRLVFSSMSKYNRKEVTFKAPGVVVRVRGLQRGHPLSRAMKTLN